MNNFQHILIAAATAAVAAASLPVYAQNHSHGHDAPTVKAVADNAAEMSEGEVRKVDKAGKKITLRHGPLKNLDMPPMTMVFHVSDPALLDKVKAGDKVRFVASNPEGKLTLTQIELAN